jgi:aldose 1-epimerase
MLSGGPVSVTVCTYGASLVRVLAPDRDGRAGDVVLPVVELAELERRRYLGSTVGRFARCIAGGRLELDGRTFGLTRNEGAHHVHGGAIGFDRFVWDAEASSDGDVAEVRLRLERPDGDQGYPGALCAQTVYRLDADGRLTFEHSATTSRPTVVDLTNHAYWNLAGTGEIDGHALAIGAYTVVEVGEDLIPLPGPPVPVVGTRYDFTSSQEIGPLRLDHCFVLRDGAPAAVLSEPRSGRTMRILTDGAGLQVYSGDILDPPRSGIALQTGALPDAPNRPDFPSARLDPGDTYRHRAVHEFSA